MPAPVTGRVYIDNNANGIFDAGDVPLANIVVRITEAVFSNGYVGTGSTDGNGNYAIDSTGMSPTNFQIQAFVNMDYSFCTLGSNPTVGTYGPGDIVDFPVKNCCTWFWQSSWVRKACWVFPNGQSNPGQLRLTFIDKSKHHLRFKTFMYPQATQAHYASIIAAPSKGRWVLHNLKGNAKVLVAEA